MINNLFVIKLFIIFTSLLHTGTLAQQTDFHVALNISVPTQYLEISPLGIKAYVNYGRKEKINFRFSISGNYQTIDGSSKIKKIGDGFFTKLEGNVFVNTNFLVENLLIGTGIGYYSMIVNDESDHAQFAGDEVVLNEDLDSNVGFNIFLEKELGGFIFNLSYVYTNLSLHQVVSSEYFYNGLKTTYELPFHLINLSVGI